MTAIRRKKVNVPTLIGRGITMLILIGLSIPRGKFITAASSPPPWCGATLWRR